MPADKSLKKAGRDVKPYKVIINFILLLGIIIAVLSFYGSSLLPLKETETVEEGEEGEPSLVSTTVESSQLSMIIRTVSIIGSIVLFYIVIFIVKNEFYLKNVLKLGWIFATPLLFLSYYMEYLFQKLPCPAHHNLELPMMLSIFMFVVIYLIMFGIIFFEVLIMAGRSIMNRRA